MPSCIIGIDPGSRFTGYGIVEGDGRGLRHVASGVVRLNAAAPFPERLGAIYRGVRALIEEFHPDAMAAEDVFFARNVKSALRLGQARGAAVLAAVNAGLPVHEYSALEIKQAVVGYGRAEKEQVGRMVSILLQLRGELNANASDALAAAVCHLNAAQSKARWSMKE